MPRDPAEAKRIARDVEQQSMDANSRLIAGSDPQGRSLPSSKSDEFVRNTGELLGNKLHKDYPENYRDYDNGMWDIEPTDPKNYGR